VYTNDYHSPDWLGYRLCLLHDVCVVDGEVTFYVDPKADALLPASMRLSAFSSGLLYKGAYEATVAKAEVPRVVSGPRPPSASYASPRDRLYLLNSLNNAQNYAHLLLDTILPAFSVALFYDLEIQDLQHAGLSTCDTFPNSNWVLKGEKSASFSAACWGNFEKWYDVIMPHPFLNAATGLPAESGSAGGKHAAAQHQPICYANAVMGHDSMFSTALFAGHMSRAAPSRAIRERAFRFFFGKPPPMELPPSSSTKKQVALVLTSMRPTSEDSGVSASLCKRTKEAVLPTWQGTADVLCMAPATMALKEQLLHLSNAAMVISEHGSTGYAGLFMTPGATLILVTPKGEKVAKEGHVLLFLPDIHTLYLTEKEVEDGKLEVVLQGRLQGG